MLKQQKMIEEESRGEQCLREYSGSEVWESAVKAGSENNEGLESEEDTITLTNYVLIDIPLCKVMKRDPDVEDFVNNSKDDERFSKHRRIEQPIIIGGIDRGGPFYTDGVIDGGNRVAQAVLGNKETMIKAYVPVNSIFTKEYHQMQATETRLEPIKVERFENDSNKEGYFFAPEEQGYSGYGKDRVGMTISTSAKIITIESSAAYVRDNNLDQIDDKDLIEKLGTDSWTEAEYNMNTEFLIKASIKDIGEYTRMYYRQIQGLVRRHILEMNKGIDVIEFLAEDDVNPHQYWVLNKEVLQPDHY